MTSGFLARRATLAAPAFALVATLALTGAIRADAPRQPVAVAVLDFDYFDTSQEARDQSADHARRLRDFMAALRRDLGQSFKVIALDCGPEPCTARSMTPQELFDAAGKAGAGLILYGGVHKMSTLVQWAQSQLVDIRKNRLIDDRRLSFRGDDDQSWRRAEAYLANKLAQARVDEK